MWKTAWDTSRGMLQLFLAIFIGAALLPAQTRPPRLIDCHVHHNGDRAFLDKLVARLDQANGLAFLLVKPNDIAGVKTYIEAHPNRLIGFGDIRLDAPNVPSDVSSDRMRVATLDLIARRFPKLTVIGAHLGNPDYAWAGEIGRWNPNLYFDVSGSTLIKKQEDYAFFKSIFWWSSVASPHTPKASATAFEKLVFGSDVFEGDLDEFDRELERYHRMLDACGVSAGAQANILS